MPIELSSADIELLKLLQHDASLSTAELAERVGMSQSPCWRRINRIEQEGIIKRKVALLDHDKLGMEVVVFTTVNLSTHGRTALQEFEREIVKFPEVVECYTMTGSMDYMLKVVTRNIRHYEIFIRTHLAQIPGIREMHSNVAVTRIKDTTELPLDTQVR